MHDVTSRWRLNRAGILNVYQHGNEALQFGGGRLLLRGVNGSGKSTASSTFCEGVERGDVHDTALLFLQT